MLGGGPYEAERCPLCGCLMWNGKCENKECENHWHTVEESEDDE